MRKNQYNLHIRLDKDERAALEKGLQVSGLPLSAYLRKLILGESIQAAPSEELRRLRTEVHQIGNNINQLARKANAGFASRDEVIRAPYGCWIVFMNSCTSSVSSRGSNQDPRPARQTGFGNQLCGEPRQDRRGSPDGLFEL